jgi:hypothetical protein
VKRHNKEEKEGGKEGDKKLGGLKTCHRNAKANSMTTEDDEVEATIELVPRHNKSKKKPTSTSSTTSNNDDDNSKSILEESNLDDGKAKTKDKGDEDNDIIEIDEKAIKFKEMLEVHNRVHRHIGQDIGPMHVPISIAKVAKIAKALKCDFHSRTQIFLTLHYMKKLL